MSRRSPSCKCCQPLCTVCGPANWSITLSGFTNGTSSSCSALNSTFLVPFLSVPETHNSGAGSPGCLYVGDVCEWYYDSVDVGGGCIADIRVFLGRCFTGINFRVVVEHGGGQTIFEKFFATESDICDGLSGENIPRDTNTNGCCNGSAASCLATSA